MAELPKYLLNLKAVFAKLDLFKKNKRKTQKKSAALVKTKKQTPVEAITCLNKLNTSTLTSNTLAEKLQPVQLIAATKIVDHNQLLSPMHAVKESIEPNIAIEIGTPKTVSTNNKTVLDNIEKGKIVPPVLVEGLTKKVKFQLTTQQNCTLSS